MALDRLSNITRSGLGSVHTYDVGGVISTGVITATAEILESDGTTVGSTLIKDADIPAEVGLEIVQNKVVLEAGERIKLSTDSNNNLSATIAVLEIT